MTGATDSIRLVAAASRRHAIMEAWIGVCLSGMTVILGLQAETWHAVGTAFAAGAFYSAAGFTAVRALTWMREAEKREPITEGGK